MPDHGTRIQHWYAKHTGWRAWEDLSNSELNKWMRWFRHHSSVLHGGGLHDSPPTVAVVVAIPLQQVLSGLQQLRRYLTALQSWSKGDQTLQCAVSLQRHSTHDFLQDHSAKNRLLTLCCTMISREFRSLGNVVFSYAESPVELELHVQQWKKAAWWRSAAVRVELGSTGTSTLPSLQHGEWMSHHFFPPTPKLTKTVMMRSIHGGGKKRGKAPKLWLFYMDDSAPHPHQLKLHASSPPEPLPWTSHTPRIQEPGEKLARFVASYVRGPGTHVVLMPTWTVGERAELGPSCTAVGYKPPHTGVLAHVEPWVACDDPGTLQACARAGKHIVFRSSPSTREAWGTYMGQLLPLSDRDSYEGLLQDVPPAKLRQAAQAHFSDSTPEFHAALTKQLERNEREIVWEE